MGENCAEDKEVLEPREGTCEVNSPEQVVQQQLEAYNSKDIDGWLATYAKDAQQYELHSGLLASGHEQMRANITSRFTEPALHARLLSRVVMDNIVIDHEVITRNFPEGIGTIEMLCIYEVIDSLISKATFKLGAKSLAGSVAAQQHVAGDV